MSKPLERGKACLDCRRRKVRCDGGYPACRRCINAGNVGDCEYQRSDGTTNVQTLEQSVARLEARIKQLQRSNASPNELQSHQPLLGIAASPSTVSPPRASQGRPLPHNISLPYGWWESSLPPEPLAKKLIQDFFAPQADQFGFFLDGDRFWQRIFPANSSRCQVPTVLVNAVLLMAVHLSGFEPLMAHQDVFLARALESAYVFQQPTQILDYIQAQLLLASFFLLQNKSLEGMHHLNAAMSLCISCGLHKQNSQGPLSAACSDVERGERIDAFWTILSMHKSWAVGLSWSTTIPDLLEEEADIPWPLNRHEYKGNVPVNPQRIPTLKTYKQDTSSVSATSHLALRFQAIFFLSLAHYLGIGWKTDLTDPEEQRAFQTHEQGIFRFLNQQIGPFNIGNGLSTEVVRNRLVTFTIAHVSIIQLHRELNNSSSNKKSLDAALSIVAALNQVNMHDWKYIDPIMGTMWVAVCHVFCRAITGLKASRSDSRQHIPPLTAGLDTVMNAMALFGERCVLINYQLRKVQEIYGSL
ncbi:hypothetical protein C8J56DRAFT_1161047 [Mycena floridula]|nr:hypothetical protein C8J56DRAFT_1161047 [Mycena floridula]